MRALRQILDLCLKDHDHVRISVGYLHRFSFSKKNFTSKPPCITIHEAPERGRTKKALSIRVRSFVRSFLCSCAPTFLPPISLRTTNREKKSCVGTLACNSHSLLTAPDSFSIWFRNPRSCLGVVILCTLAWWAFDAFGAET